MSQQNITKPVKAIRNRDKATRILIAGGAGILATISLYRWLKRKRQDRNYSQRDADGELMLFI